MRLPGCAIVRRANKPAPARPRKVERFKFMSGERNLERLSVGADIGRLAIQDHLGHHRKARARRQRRCAGGRATRAVPICGSSWRAVTTILIYADGSPTTGTSPSCASLIRRQISKERCRLCRTGEGFIVSSYQKKFIATLMPHERSLLRAGAASTISTLVDSLDRDQVSLTREIPP